MRRLFLMTLFWGSMPFFFIDPFYGVVHYSLINIIRPEQLLWGGGVGRIYLGSQIMAFLAWFVNKDKLPSSKMALPFQNKLLFVLALEMIVVTYTVAYSYDISWRWTSGFIKTSIFCFIIAKSINTPKNLERYYAAVLIWFSLLAAWGFQQKLGGNDRMEGLGGAQLPDINGLAAVYVLFLPVAYYSLYSRTKWVRYFVGIPTFIIFTIFIMFTDSRGAFLGMAVAMTYIFIRTPTLQKFKMMFTIVIVGGLLIWVLGQLAPAGFFDQYTARLMTILGEENEETGDVEREGSSAGRVAMWKGALEIYKNHSEYWLLGVGINCYARMYRNHFDEIEQVVDPSEFPLVYRGGHGGKELHNTFLSVLMGGGAIWFLSWILLIFLSWFQARRIPKRYPRVIDGIDIHNYARALEAGIVGYCVSITFVNMEFIDFFYWQLTITGAIASMGKVYLENEASDLLDEDDIIVEEYTGTRKVYPSYYA